jgi:hypothetical protein
MQASKQRTTTVAWHLPPSNPFPRKPFAKGVQDEIQIPKTGEEDRIQIRTEENKKFRM